MSATGTASPAPAASQTQARGSCLWTESRTSYTQDLPDPDKRPVSERNLSGDSPPD